jgi:hypothetical protein
MIGATLLRQQTHQIKNKILDLRTSVRISRYTHAVRQIKTMSAPDPSTDGTFEDLDDLREDGRRRFLKHHSKEELVEIIITAWRERDEKRARVQVQSKRQTAPIQMWMLTVRYRYRED